MVSSRWNSRLFLGSISKWNSLLTRAAVAFIADFFQSVWAYVIHARHSITAAVVIRRLKVISFWGVTQYVTRETFNYSCCCDKKTERN
jgi:hypothetical protein